jgi:6-phosphofructokinase
VQISYSYQRNRLLLENGKKICVNPSHGFVKLLQLICQVIHRRFQHRKIGKRKTIVIVAEGAHDASLQPIQADYVRKVLTERLGLDTRVTTLGHVQRGGRPCYYDRVLVSCTRSTAYESHLFSSLLCKVLKL